jgi:DNA polymerase V
LLVQILIPTLFSINLLKNLVLKIINDMELENFSSAAYRGTKNFGQWDIPTANATGFGAPADDYMEKGIDLNEQLIRNKPATFFMRVNSNSMVGAGIHSGDVVIVDRSIKPATGHVVIAVLNGEMLIRKLDKLQGRIRLLPATNKIAPIEVNEGSEFKIWGVVTYVIHQV